MAATKKTPTASTKITPKTKLVAKTPVKKSKVEFKTVGHVHKNLQISPRKLRLLAGKIKDLSPTEALLRLRFTNTKSARLLAKELQNLLANAKNHGLDPDSLKFVTVRIDEGLKLKRMDKSHGSRFNRGLIQKRHSRLFISAKGQVIKQ